MGISDIKSQRKNSLRLQDGRLLAWHEWGVPTGYPVLFCTGAGMSGSLGFGVSCLDRMNLRLISIDRPGFGGSDPHPEKTLNSWCQDVAELLAKQEIAVKPLAVGFSQGAPFAFALASVGTIGALSIVSGQDDFSDPNVCSLLPPPVAAFVQTVQAKDEKFLEEFGRTADADGFFNLIISMSSEKDRALYNKEPFRSAYLQCLREGFRLGPASYIQDLVNALGRWPFAVEKITVPVDFWYGELDGNPTHSPHFAAKLCQRFARQTRTVLKDEGGSLLWTRSEEILWKLSAHRGDVEQ